MNNTDTSIFECNRCGELLNEEEQADPQHEPDGELICDSCYDDIYRTTCPLCEELFDEPQQPPTPEQPQYIYAPVGMPQTGIYRVLGWPFWGGELLGNTWFEKDRLELVAQYEEPDAKTGNFICPNCVNRHINPLRNETGGVPIGHPAANGTRTKL